MGTSTVWLVKLSDRVGVGAALGFAGFSAYGAQRLLVPHGPLPQPLPVRPEAFFSEAEIRAGRRYGRPQAALALARAAIDLGLTANLVLRGRSADRLRVLPRRDRPSRDAAAAGVTAAGLTVAATLLKLPLSAVSRQRSLTAGLATDPWRNWAGDLARATMIEAALTGVLLSGSSALASRTGTRWWIYSAGGMVGVAVLAGVLGPVLLDPVFNTFEPLPTGETRTDILGLATAAGVDVGEVFSIDASRRTSTVNAYVNGLGPTKRVVLFDTLLRDYGRDEVRFVVAHELGHVRHRDLYRQIAFLALCAPSLTLGLQVLTRRWAGGLSGARAVPALSLAAYAVAAPFVLAGAALSRAVERRTDQFGLDLSDAPEALISFFRRIAVQNRADVGPGRLTRGLLATHPPITERIGAALAYQRATGPAPRTPEGS